MVEKFLSARNCNECSCALTYSSKRRVLCNKIDDENHIYPVNRANKICLYSISGSRISAEEIKARDLKFAEHEMAFEEAAKRAREVIAAMLPWKKQFLSGYDHLSP